jgi:hypothetical protein
MRDLTKRDIVAAPIGVPKGLAFEIADLVLMKGCADFRDLRMVVRLDHGADDEDYEEVVAFHARMASPCLFIMWRNARSVFVQLGHRWRYGSVAAALESLSYEAVPNLTDINAPTWPTN